MKILIMGLPGAGKTTLATALVPMLKAVWFNADDFRTHISWDLDFSPEARIHQAKRISWVCDKVSQADHYVVADFICPTRETRKIFNADFTIWIDRIKTGAFEDTNKLFEPPTKFDLRVFGDAKPNMWAAKAYGLIKARDGISFL